MKRVISIMISVVFLASFGASALAETSPVDGADNTALTAQRIYGTIVDETDGLIVIRSETNEEDEIVLNLLNSTCVIDAETGQPAAIKDRVTDRVVCFYGPAVTLSLPPQSNAVAVAVNLPEDRQSPHYAVVEAVERTDSAIKILTNGGSLYVTIDRDTPISPYLTRNIVTIDSIREGTELMLWYDAVAMSYPGQTVSKKTVVIRNATGGNEQDSNVSDDNAPGENTPDGDTLTEDISSDKVILSLETATASIHGSDVALPNIYYINDDTPMLPLRQICEALGYNVRWIPEAQSVEITKGKTTAALEFQNPMYNVNGINLVLDYAPDVKDGITFVPVDFFEKILNVNFSFRTDISK